MMSTEYGNRLKQARAHARFTQVQLSEKTEIPQSTISTAERKGQGSSETVVYAKVCGIDAHWLATGEGSMLPNDKATEDDQQSPLAELLSRLAAELARLPSVQRKMALSSVRDFSEHPANWQQLAAELQVLGVRMGLPTEPQCGASTTSPCPGADYFKGRTVYSGDQVPERRDMPERRTSGGS